MRRRRTRWLAAAMILCVAAVLIAATPQIYKEIQNWNSDRAYNQLFPLQTPQQMKYQFYLYNGEMMEDNCADPAILRGTAELLNQMKLEFWDPPTGTDAYFPIKANLELGYPDKKIEITLLDNYRDASTGVSISADEKWYRYTTEDDIQELMCLIEPDYCQVIEEQYLENLREQYFNFNHLKEVIVLNEQEHRSANWDKNAQTTQVLLERLQSLPLIECEQDDLGEKLPGGSAVQVEAQAIDVYSQQEGKWYNSVTCTYQLYEKGLSVVRRKTFTSSTAYFSCDPSILEEKLVYLVAGMDYYFGDTGQSNILLLNNLPENGIVSVSVFTDGKGAVQSRKTVQGFLTVESPFYKLWCSLRHLKILQAKEAASFWESAEIECQLSLSTGNFRLQLLGDALRIAQEGEEQVLEYTLPAQSSGRIAEAAAECFGENAEMYRLSPDA